MPRDISRWPRYPQASCFSRPQRCRGSGLRGFGSTSITTGTSSWSWTGARRAWMGGWSMAVAKPSQALGSICAGSTSGAECTAAPHARPSPMAPANSCSQGFGPGGTRLLEVRAPGQARPSRCWLPSSHGSRCGCDQWPTLSLPLRGLEPVFWRNRRANRPAPAQGTAVVGSYRGPTSQPARNKDPTGHDVGGRVPFA